MVITFIILSEVLCSQRSYHVVEEIRKEERPAIHPSLTVYSTNLLAEKVTFMVLIKLYMK